jgi:hypothetical protein
LITVRLSIINLAGIARTLVAVGTESDASMLWTTRAATPRIGSSDDAPGDARVGIGFTTGSAGVAGVVERGGVTTLWAGAGAEVAGATGAVGAVGVALTCVAVGTTGGVVAVEDFGIGGVPAAGFAAAAGAVEPGV